MFSLLTCPNEILYLIFEEACIDSGATARTLSLVSRRISAVASYFLYRNISLCGIAQVKRARKHLANVPFGCRPVCNLFIADLPSEYMCPVDVPEFWTEKSRPYQLRGSYGAERAQLFHVEVDLLLGLLAPSLQTLACLTRNPWQRFILENMGHLSFPRLTNLLLCQHTRMPFQSDAFAPPLPLVMPELRRLHLAYSGAGYADFKVRHVVQLFGQGCPRLAQLRLSDVDFYFGGKISMANMLGEMFGRRETEDEKGVTADCYPTAVRKVVIQLSKRWRPDLDEEDMKSLRSVQQTFNSQSADRFMFDKARMMRTCDEWVDEWLEVTRGGYDAWEHPMPPLMLNNCT